MPRRKPRAPEPAGAAQVEVVTAGSEAVTPADRLDPRAFLASPSDSPQAVLDWALEHAPA